MGEAAVFEERDRRALRSVAVQFAVNGAVYASFVPRLPEIRERIGVELDTLGLLLTLGTVGGLVGSALASPIIARVGTRRAMVVCGVGAVLALPVVGLATSPPVFLAGIFAWLLLDVITDIAMNMQGSWLSARRPVPVMNRLHGLWSVGTVVGGIVALVAAANDVSLTAHLVAVTVILLAALLYVAPGLLSDDEHPTENGDGTPHNETSRLGSTAILLGVLGAAAIVVEMVTGDWAAIRLVEDLGVSDGEGALGFVAFTTGMVAGRFAGDAATVRLGPARLGRAAVVVAAVGILLATQPSSLALSVAGFAIAGVGIAVFFPRLYDRAAQTPGRPAAALGAMTAGMRLGALAAPILVGGLAGTTALDVGSAMAIITLPCAALLLLLGQRKPGTGSDPATASDRRGRSR